MSHMEEDICPTCSGSGEGMTEHSNCRACKGKGVVWIEVEDESETEGEDDDTEE